jgi:serine protease Do
MIHLRFPALFFLTSAAAVAQEVEAPRQAPQVTAERLGEILAGDDPRTVAELRAMQGHVQQLIARVLPATVSLGGASGVVVDRDGEKFVLCAAHVTEKADVDMNVRLADGRSGRGISLGADHRQDVSLIRLLGMDDVQVVEVGRSKDLQPGEWVLMLGHPSGLKTGRDAPARLGRVLRVPDRGYLVTDCTMQGGDSGGPLFDMQGRVVGINSRISRSLAQNMHAPVDAITSQWDDLLAGKVTQQERPRGRRSRLGLGVDLAWDDEGGVVEAVTPPAGEEGPEGVSPFVVGDRILEVEGRAVDSRRRLRGVMMRRAVGDEVEVLVARDGEEVKLQVRLMEAQR